MVMLVYSFMEVLWSAPLFYRSLKGAVVELLIVLRPGRTTRRPRLPQARERSRDVSPDEVEDPAPPHEQIKTWQWTGGLAMSSVATLLVGKYAL